MNIRRHVRLFVLVGGIMVLFVRTPAQVKPQDTQAGDDQQFFMQMDDAHAAAHAIAKWTNTRSLTLDYNLSNSHASPPDNGMYHAVRFYHSSPPKNWIEFPDYPTPDEWQSVSFYLDGVNEPGSYVVTGDFKWSQGVDHYRCHVFFDTVKPTFVPTGYDTGDFLAGLATGTKVVDFKFTDNMADTCWTSGAVYRAGTNDAIGGFKGSQMRCGVVNSATLVPNIGLGFKPGNYYLIIYITDLAGNMTASDKKPFLIGPAKPTKPAKPVKR